MNKLIIGGREFSSRLFVGTGKFSSNELMEKAIEAGREIPQSFFENAKPKKTPLQSAFALIGTGIGITAG